MTPYFELSPESFLLMNPSARGLRHQKNPFNKKAESITKGILFERKKGKASTMDAAQHSMIIGFVFPLLSEREDIMRGIIIADNWQRAIRVPEKECEYPLFLKII